MIQNQSKKKKPILSIKREPTFFDPTKQLGL